MVLGVAASSLVLQNALVGYLDAFVTGPDKEKVNCISFKFSHVTFLSLPFFLKKKGMCHLLSARRLLIIICTGHC